MSPGDFDSMLIKAGDSKTKESLRGKEVTGEPGAGGLCFGSLETLEERSEPR